MQSLRKIGASRAILKNISGLNKPAVAQFVRSSSILIEKEKGDESKYFRAEDERMKNEMRAKIEAILASSTPTAEKEKLMEIFGIYILYLYILLCCYCIMLLNKCI